MRSAGQRVGGEQGDKEPHPGSCRACSRPVRAVRVRTESTCNSPTRTKARAHERDDGAIALTPKRLFDPRRVQWRVRQHADVPSRTLDPVHLSSSGGGHVRRKRVDEGRREEVLGAAEATRFQHGRHRRACTLQLLHNPHIRHSRNAAPFEPTAHEPAFPAPSPVGRTHAARRFWTFASTTTPLQVGAWGVVRGWVRAAGEGWEAQKGGGASRKEERRRERGVYSAGTSKGQFGVVVERLENRTHSSLPPPLQGVWHRAQEHGRGKGR